MSARAPVVDIALRPAADRDVARIAAIYADHVLTGSLGEGDATPPVERG